MRGEQRITPINRSHIWSNLETHARLLEIYYKIRGNEYILKYLFKHRLANYLFIVMSLYPERDWIWWTEFEDNIVVLLYLSRDHLRPSEGLVLYTVIVRNADNRLANLRPRHFHRTVGLTASYHAQWRVTQLIVKDRRGLR